MKGIFMGLYALLKTNRIRICPPLTYMHIKRIDTEIISRQVQTLEYTCKRQVLSITVNDNIL